MGITVLLAKIKESNDWSQEDLREDMMLFSIGQVGLSTTLGELQKGECPAGSHCNHCSGIRSLVQHH